jgi:hypothetical protein
MQVGSRVDVRIEPRFPSLPGSKRNFSEDAKMKSITLMVLLLATWPWSSVKEYHMTASNSVPAATGLVKVQIDKENGNTKLEIKVFNLADPARLTPPANDYVVWIRPSGGDAVKQGAIRVDKNQKGQLKVVTTSKDCDVFITAEQSESASAPSDVEVLQTHIMIK